MVTTAIIQATGAFFRHGGGSFSAAGQLGAALASGGQRYFSSIPQTSELKAVLAQKIPKEQVITELLALARSALLGQCMFDAATDARESCRPA
jgi:hypothetical protein